MTRHRRLPIAVGSLAFVRSASLCSLCCLLSSLLLSSAVASAHPLHAVEGTLQLQLWSDFAHLVPDGLSAGAWLATVMVLGALITKSISYFTVRPSGGVVAQPPEVGAPVRSSGDDQISRLRTIVVLIPVLCSAAGFAVGCGGSGGDGGGSSSSTTLHRTTDTAVRILHAGLDFEPVDLKVGDMYLSHAGFLEQNFYVSLDHGPETITLERANSPGVVVNQTQATLAAKTAYSVLISGQVSQNTLQVTLLEEPIVRPEKGQGRVKIVNLLENGGRLAMAATGVALGPVPFRTSSDYATVPSGPLTVTITNERGGTLAVTAIDIPDRGDATVVMGGDNRQGVVIERTFVSLS